MNLMLKREWLPFGVGGGWLRSSSRGSGLWGRDRTRFGCRAAPLVKKWSGCSRGPARVGGCVSL